MHKFNEKKLNAIKYINSLGKLIYHTKKYSTPIDLYGAQNILIIDVTNIGDIVMLTPFLRILRKNSPKADITLVCASWGETVLRDQGLVDKFVIVDPSNIKSMKKMVFNHKTYNKYISAINSTEYDFAIEPKGDLRYIYFMYQCNAKRKISYNYTGGEFWLTDVIVPSPKIEHLVEDKMYLLKQIGCTYQKEDVYPKLYLTDQQKKEIDGYRGKLNNPSEIIIGIHPGASIENKEWKYYDKLVEQLHSQNKRIAFLVFEGPNEHEIAAAVMRSIEKCGAKGYCSKTNILEYMKRIALCDAVVCNDSGAAHIAAAYGVPVFVIFGSTLPSLGMPYTDGDAFIFSNNDFECKPCMQDTCYRGNMECLDTISVKEVSDSILKFSDSIGE